MNHDHGLEATCHKDLSSPGIKQKKIMANPVKIPA